MITHEEILNLGWKHDPNLDSEEWPSLFDKHGYSLGYEIDTQDTNGVCLILYYFPDGWAVIESIIDCGTDVQFSGFILRPEGLETVVRNIRQTTGRF